MLHIRRKSFLDSIEFLFIQKTHIFDTYGYTIEGYFCYLETNVVTVHENRQM